MLLQGKHRLNDHNLTQFLESQSDSKIYIFFLLINEFTDFEYQIYLCIFIKLLIQVV